MIWRTTGLSVRIRTHSSPYRHDLVMLVVFSLGLAITGCYAPVPSGTTASRPSTGTPSDVSPPRPVEVMHGDDVPADSGIAPGIREHVVRRTDAQEPVTTLHALLDLFARGVNHPLTPTRWRVAGLSHYQSIHQAVAAGDLYAVVDRVAGGDALNDRDGEGRTPLLVAAAENQPYIADYLLEHGAQLSDQDMLGNSVVHLAARASHIYTLENFLRRGAPLDRRNLNGYTPLHVAAEAGDLFVVEHLVANGANLFAMQDDDVLSIPSVLAARKRHWDITRFFRAKGQYFPIHMMAAQGDVPGVAEAIADLPAAVNLLDSMQNTPLVSAIRTGECETAALLLDSGADPFSRNMEGDFPLAIALRRGHIACAKLLLERGANINEPLHSGNELTLLGEAVRSAPVETVSFILEHGGDPRMAWEGGQTALHVAVEVAGAAKARLLVGAGADPTALNAAGWSPLLLAAERGLLPLVQVMATRTDLLEASSPDGRRPMHEAAGGGHHSMVDWLLSRGVSISSVDNYGRTALHRAASGGHTATVTLLLDRGASLEAVDPSGNTPFLAAADHQGSTPLILAASGGHYDTVVALLRRGAAIDAINSAGLTALQAACEMSISPGDYPLREENYRLRAYLNAVILEEFRAAATWGDVDRMKALLTAYPDYSNAPTFGRTPAHWAAQHGRTRILELLRDHGADLLRRADTAAGYAPVHFAARYGHVDTVAWLLENGTPSDLLSASGETPEVIVPLTRSVLVGESPQ